MNVIIKIIAQTIRMAQVTTIIFIGRTQCSERSTGDYYIQGQRYNRVYNLASDYLEGWDELGAQITVSDSDDSWFVQFYGQNITDNESIYYRNLESTAVGNYQRIMARERARYGVRAGWNF